MTEKFTQLYLPKGEWLDPLLTTFKKANLELSAPPRCYEYQFVSSSIPIIFQTIRSKEVCLDIFDENTTVNGGFTGSDITLEQGINFQWSIPLNRFEDDNSSFPKPKVCLGSTPNFRENEDYPNIQALIGKTIYTSYPNITKKFFEDNKIDVKIIERQGTIEGRWRTNLDNWAIVDVVDSGSTMKANQIEILQEIMTPEIVFVENPIITRQDKSRIDDLKEQLYIASKN